MKTRMGHHWALLLLGLLAATTLVTASKSDSSKGDNKKQVNPPPSTSINQNARQDSPAIFGAKASSSVDISGSTSGSNSAIQQVAEKKQGDQDLESNQDSSLLNNEEYVQIKPEEINVNENGKEIIDSVSLISNSPSDRDSSQVIAEHKSSSVDEELNAHLAQDTISQLESVYQPYTALAPPSSQAQSVNPSQATRKVSHHQEINYQQQPAGYKPIVPIPAQSAGRYQRARAVLPPPAPAPAPARIPPSYITLKGKLTGINSLISQYPHPAPGYPHQGPRHLPRGAAAGYAAFRDFVRAHASKYKHAPLVSTVPIYPTALHPMQPISGPVEQPAKDVGYGKPAASYPATQALGQSYATPSVTGSPVKSTGYGAQKGSGKNKLSVAQAYIPQIIQGNSNTNGYGADEQQQAGYTNQVLAQLYGNHAPQGVGKPEFNKDYGMVIHYPQATVYTEPMTVEQLHKLTGGGISQVIEQLQYNLAHGHRDESNIINAHNKHHIGNGITIHAKEYHAPGKGGHYVPTTAAVLSTSNGYESTNSDSNAYQVQGNNYEQQQSSYEATPKVNRELGSGYERVKQAVAAGQEKYSNNANNHRQEYPQQQQQQQPADGYEQSSMKYGGGNGEPLSAITGLIGSELEALYKANAALTKQLEPEIQAQLQNFVKSPQAKGPLRYTQHEHRSPLTLSRLPYQKQAGQHYQGGQSAGRQHRGGRGGHRKNQRGHNRYPAAPQRQHHHQQQHQMRPYGPAQMFNYGPAAHEQQQQQQQHRYQQQHQQYNQQQANHAVEQALNQQMNQLLHEIQAGEEQYNGKSHSMIPASQGYPNRLLQKYNRPNGGGQYGGNNQQDGNKQQASVYGQLEGLEIPQGPNDQIGEIADLIESLKGTFDSNKHEQTSQEAGYSASPALKQTNSKLEDVKYLATALGQVPSYAMQVPVAQGDVYEAKKVAPSAQGAYQQQASIEQQVGYQQQQQQGYGQQQGENYGAQAQPGYGNSQDGGYGSQAGQKQADYQQTPQSGPQDHDYSGAATIGNQLNGAYPSPVGQHVVAGTYPTQPANSAVPAATDGHQHQQQQHSGYSNQEHTQIINHLVPVQQTQVSGAYDSQNGAHHHQEQQPVNQIAIAAPTDSHYQQAQSLSSFVDSLPTDYQELLRQPAILNGNSSIAHLAALGQEVNSYGTNSTVSGNGESAGHDANQTSGQAHQGVVAAAVAQQTATYQATGSQNQQSQYQQQQQQQQQYATVKK